MKRAIAILLLVVFLLISAKANAAVYMFEWTGFVEMIEDIFGLPAPLDGVNVDDWFVATVTYDTAAFGPGVVVIDDILDYPAPAGLQMTYQFESGGVFSKDISAVRAAKQLVGATKDQWNWKGGDFGGLLFQANDWLSASFTPDFPTEFDVIHAQFLSSLSNFEPSSGNHLGVNMGDSDPDNDRIVFFTDQAFSVTLAVNPITEILNFMDSSIEDGDLFGIGRGRSASNRLNALRNMIVAAGELIEAGFYEDACRQLDDAYMKCDGLNPPDSPPDFVNGPATPALAAMILNLIVDLGCS